MLMTFQFSRAEIEASAVYLDSINQINEALGIPSKISFVDKVKIHMGLSVSVRTQFYSYTLNKEYISIALDIDSLLVVEVLGVYAETVTALLPSVVGFASAMNTIMNTAEIRLTDILAKYVEV